MSAQNYDCSSTDFDFNGKVCSEDLPFTTQLRNCMLSADEPTNNKNACIYEQCQLLNFFGEFKIVIMLSFSASISFRC